MGKNANCDGSHCKSSKGIVKLLPYSSDGNMIFCHSCYIHEIDDRKERIKEGVPWSLPEWENLKTYEVEEEEVIRRTIVITAGNERAKLYPEGGIGFEVFINYVGWIVDDKAISKGFEKLVNKFDAVKKGNL